MDISLIEKIDKSRYRFYKWLTIGWSFWFSTFILKGLINDKIILVFLLLIGLTGGILFVINLFKFARLGKKVNADSKLKEALNNEMHQLYKYKSFFWGFWVVIVTNGIFLLISRFIRYQR